MDNGKRLALAQAEIHYWPCFIAPNQSKYLFNELLTSTPWQQDTIKLFGKALAIPRLQSWHGDRQCKYSYSGIELIPQSWTETLIAIRRLIENHTGDSFNSVLLNLYRNGQDSNGWHADDEPELGHNPVIASLSLGETRRFRLRHRSNKTIKPLSLDLTDGSLLVMSGPTQHYWQHCLTKTSRTVGSRINLTFRHLHYGQN